MEKQIIETGKGESREGEDEEKWVIGHGNAVRKKK